ncbi:MAG: hypothetical protein ACM3XO_12740 [Bacteroidota bacterium]
MQITFNDFKAFVGTIGLHTAGLHAIERVHKITQTFYCDKLTVRSACSGQCESCILTLKTRIADTKWAFSTNKYGLYTWLVKDVSGKVMEAARAEEKSAPLKTQYGEPVEGDALDLFMETINE